MKRLLNQSGINRVIRVLITHDFFLNYGWGLISPIFAIFVVEEIGGDAKVVGIAVMIFWIIKSLLQIPIGFFLDSKRGDKDDLYFMIAGLFISGLAPLGFLISYAAWHIYFLYAVHGIGLAMYIPAWYAVFTKNIDKGKEAFEWSIQSTSLGVGTGLAGVVGGFFVVIFGFEALFWMVSVFNFFSLVLILFIAKDIVKKGEIRTFYPPEKEEPGRIM